MASIKKLERKIDQMGWLTEQEAMTYVDKCQSIFESDWMPYLNQYDNGGTLVFRKSQIDEFMEYRKVISGMPYSMWKPRTK